MASVRHRPIAPALGVVLIAAAACSDSTGPSAPLTSDEISELARQMGVFVSSDLRGPEAVTTDRVRLNAIPGPISASVDFTIVCPKGGTARITGTLDGTSDPETESAIVEVTARQRTNDCGYDVHGKTIRTTGTLTANAHLEIENGLPVGTHTASLVGEFSWRANDGRRGTCMVDYSATANYDMKVSTLNGNFCGATIQFSGPLTTN